MNTPKTKLDEYETKALNLGVKSAAANFDAEDNPYLLNDPRYEAWQRGYILHRLFKVAE